jgi:hypothetical protein
VKRARAELYDHLVKEVPRALRRAGLAPNQCILASRLGVELLRHHGIKARAVATDLSVHNAPFGQAIYENPTLTDKELWDTAADNGAWAIWVSRHDVSQIGHVVVVADNRVLIDLTAHQANRPAKQIHAEAFWHESPEFARGERTLFRTDDGCMWLYEPRLCDRDFVKSPAWSAYRISIRGGCVISERFGPAGPEPVAAEVRVPIHPAP